jgi:hypothetical protein
MPFSSQRRKPPHAVFTLYHVIIWLTRHNWDLRYVSTFLFNLFDHSISSHCFLKSIASLLPLRCFLIVFSMCLCLLLWRLLFPPVFFLRSIDHPLICRLENWPLLCLFTNRLVLLNSIFEKLPAAFRARNSIVFLIIICWRNFDWALGTICRCFPERIVLALISFLLLERRIDHC